MHAHGSRVTRHPCPKLIGSSSAGAKVPFSAAGNATGAQIMGREVYDSLSRFLEAYMVELLEVCA